MKFSWRQSVAPYWPRAACAVLAGLALAAFEPGVALAGQAAADGETAAAKSTELTMDTFLDRLMRAESGGNDKARNPSSTALGPYQFIASTWLMMMHRYFKTETADLNAVQILNLRTDRNLARRAAEAYTRDNAAYLAAQGQTTTFQNLRLAFLVGPGGAARILASPPEARVSTLLGSGVVGANPFMANLTASGLIARAARDITADPNSTAGVAPDPARIFAELYLASVPEFAAVLLPPVAHETAFAFDTIAAGARKQKALAQIAPAIAERPKIQVDCDLSLPSCRRWLALAERQQKLKSRRASKSAPVAQ